jgi:hypothetical protein
VFALGADDPPDPDYVARVEAAYSACDAHVVRFPTVLTGGSSSNTVYVARVADARRR